MNQVAQRGATTAARSGPRAGRWQRWLAVGTILCLLSMLGAGLVQNGFGRTTVKNLSWETADGMKLNAMLFVPKGASAEDKRPAIVTTHGWYNTKEMQDLNYVEMARRGYVVLALDLYGHGNSDYLVDNDFETAGTGMTRAVELISTLPYVDATRIGITGHSNGARASNLAINDDNKKASPLIRSVLLIANDATYAGDDGKPMDKYGKRAAGVVAAQYDEFFFRAKQPDGTTSAPKDYIKQATAQSFLAFGKVATEQRRAGEIYTAADGGSRVIYTPKQIHPWNHFSKTVVTDTLDFFQASLGAPNPINSSHQVWQWKVVFNTLGLIGFAIFLYSLTVGLLQTRFFGSVRATSEVRAMSAPTGAAKAWYWAALALGVVFSIWTYLSLFSWAMRVRPRWLVQAPTFYIGTWAAATGLFSLALLVISWLAFGRRSGISLSERGVIISPAKLGKTVLLALIVVVTSFLWVFVSTWLFHVDFRLWVITIKAFGPDKLPIMLTYLPFLLLFYVVNSVAINSFNFVGMGRREWINTAVLALFNVLGALIMVLVQYTYFFTTGKTFTESVLNPPVSNIVGIWLFPLLVYFPAAAVLDRMLFRRTRNPYLGGIIMALLMTAISVANTLTQV